VFEDKKNLVECKLTYEAQLGKVSTLQDNLKRINRSWQKKELLAQFDVLNMRSTNLGTLNIMPVVL
jgi:exonuclease SbcC